MKTKLPELYKTETLGSVENWIGFLEDFGHLWFYIDERYYFLFPLGAHRYGLCYGEDEQNGNSPRWVFESELAFIHAKSFNGKSIIQRENELLSWDPPFLQIDD